MQYTPKTEKEIQEALVWPKGTYDFEVIKAEKAVGSDTSKNPGMEYIKLSKVQIWNDAGETRFINGVLHPKMEAQLRHFCYATGIGAVYESGKLRADHCEGRTGKLKLKVKDAEGNYPAKNEIADFEVPKEGEAVTTKSGPTTPTGEDDPFA